MNEFDNEPWLADARRLLDESTGALDAATLSRLNRARQSALAGARGRSWTFGWFAAAGLACSALLLLALAVQRPPPAAPSAAPRTATSAQPPARAPAPASGVAASGVAAAAPAEADPAPADDSLDFYQDLEFYAWLDAQDGDGDGDG